MSVAADGNFPSEQSTGGKDYEKEWNQEKDHDGGDGGACGQKKVGRHALWKKVEGELRKGGLLKGT